MTMTVKRSAFVGLALLAALGVLMLLMHTSSARSQAPATVGSAADHTYSLLARAATPDDVAASQKIDPGKWAAVMPELGIDIASVRVIRQTAEKTTVVLRRADAACLATAGANGRGLTCATNEEPSAATMIYGSAVGLVPDSVRSVTFHQTDGTEVTVSVVNNVWEAPAEADSATFTIEGEEKHVTLMPLSALPKGAKLSPDGVVSTGRSGP
jgi:hypothetical protein